MRPGDRVFIYHSGGQSAIVGLAKVLELPHADPKDPKSMVVKLGYISHLSPPTVSAEVKKSKLFDDWALVRQSRLSTMAVPDRFVDWMRERYPESLLEGPEPLQHGIHQRNRQADHVEIVAFDPVDEFRRQALDCVRAGLIHRLP